MIDVRSYTSYRKFLKDLLDQQKKDDPSTTLATFAKVLNLSTSAFQMILSGQRNLTVAKLHQVAEAIRLAPEEYDFFESLVHYEQAQSDREKSFYARRLEIKEKQKATKTVHLTRRELLSEWYFPAFMFYLVDRAYDPAVGDFVIDYAYLEDVFALKKDEVDKLVEKLKELGALEIKRDDKAHVAFDKVGGFLTSQNYCLKVLEEVQKRVKARYTDKSSYFTAHVLSMTQENFLRFVDEYKQLRSKYVEAAPDSPDDSEHVAQVFFSIFPVL